MNAFIKLTAENHELALGHIVLKTIFGDVHIPNESVEVLTKSIIKVPMRYFDNAMLAPSQLINGFIRVGL